MTSPQPSGSLQNDPPVVEIPQPPGVEIPQPSVVDIPQPPVVEIPQPPVVEIPQPPVVEIPQPPVVEIPQPPVVEIPQPPVVEIPQPPVVEVPEPPVVEVPGPPVMEGERDSERDNASVSESVSETTTTSKASRLEKKLAFLRARKHEKRIKARLRNRNPTPTAEASNVPTGNTAKKKTDQPGTVVSSKPLSTPTEAQPLEPGNETSATGPDTVTYLTQSVEDELEAVTDLFDATGREDVRAILQRFDYLQRSRAHGRQGRGEEDEDLDWDGYEDSSELRDEAELEHDQQQQQQQQLERIRRLGAGHQSNDNDELDFDAFDETEGAALESSKGMSKKKLKFLQRPTVAQLKQACSRPEVVECWDLTAPDPWTLVFLKAHRNTVPVPNHWSHKRRYLQRKRGIEKPLFKLPPHIEATKISDIRSAIEQKEAQKTLKQKQRERARPQHQKMNINYQVLHDAFFKYATKPPYTKFGEVYFEGRETELQMRRYRPDRLSDRTKEALGMRPGHMTPTPWLYNMQRYGPPPSYPNLAIPGINAHLPEGAALGFQPGGWGKPPTAEQLQMWGCVPRFEKTALDAVVDDAVVDRNDSEQGDDRDATAAKGPPRQLWGQLKLLESESEVESETSDGEETGPPAAGVSDKDTAGVKGGVVSTISGFESVMTGGIRSQLGQSTDGGISSVLLQPGMLSNIPGIASTITFGLETPRSVNFGSKG